MLVCHARCALFLEVVFNDDRYVVCHGVSQVRGRFFFGLALGDAAGKFRAFGNVSAIQFVPLNRVGYAQRATLNEIMSLLAHIHCSLPSGTSTAIVA
jgi:hypothetical protein